MSSSDRQKFYCRGVQVKTMCVDSLRNQGYFLLPLYNRPTLFCVFILLYSWFQFDDLDLLYGQIWYRKYIFCSKTLPFWESFFLWILMKSSISRAVQTSNYSGKDSKLKQQQNHELNEQHAYSFLNRIPTRIHGTDLLVK